MFSNKVVLITGGSSGIGATTAECFAKEGASLAIVGRNVTNLNKVAQRCKNHGSQVLVIKADIAKDEEAKTIVEHTINKYGKLDVLVNSAGLFLQDVDVMKIYDEMMSTNLRALVYITTLAVPYLKQTKGNVVNVSSANSMIIRFNDQIVDGMAKIALDYFMKGMARVLGPSGVRLNAVSPGPVKTNLVVGSEKKYTDLTVLKRMSEIEEIGDLILYLASDKARSVTGSCFAIDNGYLLE